MVRHPVIKGLDVWQHGEGKMVIAGQRDHRSRDEPGSQHGRVGRGGWVPSFHFSDPRVRWEAIDDTHARLVFPFEGGEDSLVYTFDPKTDSSDRGLGMRYKAGAAGKIGWTVRTWAGRRSTACSSRREVDVKWADEKVPWATLDISYLAINVPVPKLDAE